MSIQLLLVVGGAFVLGFFVCYVLLRRREKEAPLSKVSPELRPQDERTQRSVSASDPVSPSTKARATEPEQKPPTAGELLKQIAEATSYEEVNDAVRLSSDSTVARAGAARVLALVTEKLRSVSTVGECLSIYDDTPGVDENEEDVAGNAVLERALVFAVDYPSSKEIIDRFDGEWPSDDYQNQVLERALSFAASFEEVLALCSDYDEGDAVLVKIFTRALELASTTGQVLELYKQLDSDTEFAYLVHAKARSLVSTLEDALEMCEELEDDDETALQLLERVLILAASEDKAGTLSEEDLTRVFDLVVTFVDNDEEDEVTIRIRSHVVELIGTVDEALELYGKLNQDYEDSAFSATVLDRALALASSYEECEQVREQVVTSDDELELRVVARMLMFVTTVEECESLWNGLEVSSNVARAAILRAADIIRANP